LHPAAFPTSGDDPGEPVLGVTLADPLPLPEPVADPPLVEADPLPCPEAVAEPPFTDALPEPCPEA